MLCAGQSQNCPDPCFTHEHCAANPWFVPQTMDPGFAQVNPGIVQIQAMRVTHVLAWNEHAYSIREYMYALAWNEHSYSINDEIHAGIFIK